MIMSTSAFTRTMYKMYILLIIYYVNCNYHYYQQYQPLAVGTYLRKWLEISMVMWSAHYRQSYNALIVSTTLDQSFKKLRLKSREFYKEIFEKWRKVLIFDITGAFIQDTFVVDSKIMIIRILSGVTVEVSVTLELFDTCELVSDHRSMLDWIYLSKIDTLAWVKVLILLVLGYIVPKYVENYGISGDIIIIILLNIKHTRLNQFPLKIIKFTAFEMH